MQKESQVKQLFALSGSERITAARKHIDKIDPRSEKSRSLKGTVWYQITDGTVVLGSLNISMPAKKCTQRVGWTRK